MVHVKGSASIEVGGIDAMKNQAAARDEELVLVDGQTA
jgi:hypothetical protein